MLRPGYATASSLWTRTAPRAAVRAQPYTRSVATIVRIAKRHLPSPAADWLRYRRREVVRLITGVDVQAVARESASVREEVLAGFEQRTLDLLARQDTVLASYDRRVAALVNRVLDLEERLDGGEPSPEARLDPHIVRSTALSARLRGAVNTHLDERRLLEELLEPCIGLLSEHAPVLDVGGSTAMLERLHSAAVPATSVGADPDTAALLGADGLDVQAGNPLMDVARRPDDSAGAVTLIGMVEGLELDDIDRLLRDVRRVLRPDGIVVLAASYPTSAESLARFWRDPYRVRPWDASVLRWLVDHAGLDVVDVRTATGANGDYVLIARHQ
jgi:SAM-dependent methyltransferase